jgi:hypothetical protein
MAETLSAEKLMSDYYAYKKSLCGSSRAAYTRASDLGHPCMAYIAFTRVAGEKADRPDAKLSCIFAEGRLQERGVFSDLAAMGYQVEQSQRAVYWDQFEISGHIDGWLGRDGSKPVLVEVKSCSPFAFAKFQTADDIKRAKQYFYAKWLGQIQVYMLLDNREEAWLILKNKATGELRVLPVTLDLEFAESLIKKAQEVKTGVPLGLQETGKDSWQAWLKTHRLNDAEICLECSFKAICLPDIDAGAGVVFADDGETAEMLKRWHATAEASEEHAELDDTIKTRARRILDHGKSKEILCGDFFIRGTRVEPKGKNPYWKVDIGKLAGVRS